MNDSHWLAVLERHLGAQLVAEEDIPRSIFSQGPVGSPMEQPEATRSMINDNLGNSLFWQHDELYLTVLFKKAPKLLGTLEARSKTFHAVAERRQAGYLINLAAIEKSQRFDYIIVKDKMGRTLGIPKTRALAAGTVPVKSNKMGFEQGLLIPFDQFKITRLG